MGIDQNNSFTPAFFSGHPSDCGCENTCDSCAAEYAAPRHGKGGKPAPVNENGEAHVWFDACDGRQSLCISTACQDVQLMGRVLDVTATLQNVCPGRRSSVGLTLCEVDEKGTEYARGFRAVSVPAHHGSCNRDVQLDAVRFILPEDMSLQHRRHFICRMEHHYLDADHIWG